MEENVTPSLRKTKSLPKECWDKSFFQRITGIFFEPTSVFQSLDEKPDIVTAIAIALLATLIGFIGSGLIWGIIWGHNLSSQALEQMSTFEKVIIFAKYAHPFIGGIYVMIFAIAALLIKAVLIHVLVPFLDGKSTYTKVVSVLGYASAPLILFSILLLVYALLNPNAYPPLTASLSLFFTPDKVGPVWSSLYSQIDLFVLWSLFLSIQGLSVIYKFTWKKSAAIILLLWILSISIQTGGVLIAHRFFSEEQPAQTKDDSN